MDKDTSKWISRGRGDVSAQLAKSGSEILAQESEVAQEGMEPTGTGKDVRQNGMKPLYATGDKPFHEGRGLGRGHGTGN